MSMDTLKSFYREYRLKEEFARLFEAGDAGAFAGALVAFGKEKGFDFEETQVLAALDDPSSFLNDAMAEEELSDAELAVMSGRFSVLAVTLILPSASTSALLARFSCPILAVAELPSSTTAMAAAASNLRAVKFTGP